MRNQQCRPLDRARAVLVDGPIADRKAEFASALVEPVGGEVVDQGPQPPQRGVLAPCLACTAEGLVGDLAPIESEIGGCEVIVGRLRIAAVEHCESSLRVHRNRGADFAERVDGCGVSLQGEARRRHLHLGRRVVDSNHHVAGLGESGTGHPRLRKAKESNGQSRTIGVEQNLLGRQFAPWVSHDTHREHSLHVRQVGLHVMMDAALGKLPCEIAEVLGEDSQS